jgi:OOP family OmpA-OmpF porin
VASVEAVPGVRLVNDETRLVPEAKPYVWSAERDVVRVTLGGNAPLPSSKSKLTEAAKAGLGGVEVVDQMALARGAPQRFDPAALLLLDQIGKLKEGKITLTDNKVALAGMARELGGREAIAAALRRGARVRKKGSRFRGSALRALRWLHDWQPFAPLVHLGIRPIAA